MFYIYVTDTVDKNFNLFSALGSIDSLLIYVIFDETYLGCLACS